MSSGRRATVRFGNYELVELLGTGGMAEVWKAKRLGPSEYERTLVIKRILPHYSDDPEFVQMFLREAQISARLNHSNIVQVFELGEVNGRSFLAMEYFRGGDLRAVVRAFKQNGPPPPGLSAYVGRELCRALEYVHSMRDDAGEPLRLVHRDVSPSNVMIGYDGGVKLFDFGIAKAIGKTGPNRTITGVIKGKLAYMAPEQLDGRDPDHRADIFAVGVVLHELLTGERLFDGDSDLQIMARVRETKVSAPSHRNTQIPAALDRICLRALQTRPEDRYASAEEMALELDAVAHELKWGPAQAAAMMRERVKEAPRKQIDPAAIAETTPQGPPVAVSATPWLKRPPVWIGAVLVVALGGALVGRMLRPPPPPPAKVEPAVVEPAKVEPPPAKVEPPPAKVEPPPAKVEPSPTPTVERAIPARKDKAVRRPAGAKKRRGTDLKGGDFLDPFAR